MREPVLWLIAVAVVVASWLAIPVALRVFYPLPPDTPPDAFLGVGPPWFYVALLFAGFVTIGFAVTVVLRVCFAIFALLRSSARAKVN